MFALIIYSTQIEDQSQRGHFDLRRASGGCEKKIDDHSFRATEKCYSTKKLDGMAESFVYLRVS